MVGYLFVLIKLESIGRLAGALFFSIVKSLSNSLPECNLWVFASPETAESRAGNIMAEIT